MGKTNPILQGAVSNWDDGVTDYGFTEPREGDLELYILAHRSRDYEVLREEGGDEIPVEESQFKLYDPEKLSVEQHRSMKQNGFHFHSITESDLIRMLKAGFDGRSCVDG